MVGRVGDILIVKDYGRCFIYEIEESPSYIVEYIPPSKVIRIYLVKTPRGTTLSVSVRNKPDDPKFVSRSNFLYINREEERIEKRNILDNMRFSKII